MLTSLKTFLLKHIPPLRRFSQSEKAAEAAFRARFIEEPSIVLTHFKNIQRVELPSLTDYFPCNPSVLADGDGFTATVRGVNYDSDVFYNTGFTEILAGPPPDSMVFLYKLDKGLNIVDSCHLDDSELRSSPRAGGGIADARLIEWKNQIWIAGASFEPEIFGSNYTLARIDGSTITDVQFIDSPLGKTIEKNWTPILCGDELYFLYTYYPFVLFRFEDGELKIVNGDVSEYEDFTISGGSIATRFRDGFIAVVHRWGFKERYVRRYTHQIALLDSNMRPIGFGPPFRFEHDGIEFCAGLALTEDSAIFSYGVNDKKAVLLKIGMENLERLLPPT